MLRSILSTLIACSNFQPIGMLKNHHSIDLRWKVLYAFGLFGVGSATTLSTEPQQLPNFYTFVTLETLVTWECHFKSFEKILSL